jgi:hypothetical protein
MLGARLRSFKGKILSGCQCPLGGDGHDPASVYRAVGYPFHRCFNRLMESDSMTHFKEDRIDKGHFSAGIVGSATSKNAPSGYASPKAAQDGLGLEPQGCPSKPRQRHPHPSSVSCPGGSGWDVGFPWNVRSCSVSATAVICNRRTGRFAARGWTRRRRATLPAWPDGARTTRIVCIIRTIEQFALEHALSAFVERETAAR